MSWFPGDYGDVWIDDATGEIVLPEVYGSLETPVIITDPRYSDYGDQSGSGYSWLTSPGKATAQYVDTAPEEIGSGSALNPLKLVVDAAGRYYQYKAQNVNGRQVYVRNPYTGGATGGLFGMSPVMLAAFAGLAFIALSDKGK